jgi:hypothetical protein
MPISTRIPPFNLTVDATAFREAMEAATQIARLALRRLTEVKKEHKPCKLIPPKLRAQARLLSR